MRREVRRDGEEEGAGEMIIRGGLGLEAEVVGGQPFMKGQKACARKLKVSSAAPPSRPPTHARTHAHAHHLPCHASSLEPLPLLQVELCPPDTISTDYASSAALIKYPAPHVWLL